MSKHRKTREQKIKSSQRKLIETKNPKIKEQKENDENILTVDVKYIKKDLLKTLLISIVVIILIFGLNYYLK